MTDWHDVRTVDEFMQAAIDEARAGFEEGGIPIGSVLVHSGRILGRGRNRRVQRDSAVLHGEMDALENAGRLPARVYRQCTLYTTLSPCPMCSGAILLYAHLIRHPAYCGAARPRVRDVSLGRASSSYRRVRFRCSRS